MEKKEKLDLEEMLFLRIPRVTKILIFHPAVIWVYWKSNQKERLWMLLRGEIDFTAYGGGMNWLDLILFIWKDEKIVGRSFGDNEEKTETLQK
jgi:hypothetical protein